MIVVDASVAVKWVLPEPDSGPAVALREADALIAPSLVIAEIGNAFWKSVLRGDVDKSDAYAALQIAVAHFERIVPIDQLAARALELAVDLRHPIYDCLYLALAERERVPIVSGGREATFSREANRADRGKVTDMKCAVGARALSHRKARQEAGDRDELSEGHQGVHHAGEHDGRTVAAMDVLAPGIGEIIGGSQREERLPVLDARMAERGIDRDHYAWYRDLRRYGTVPHAGFGLGFERTLAYVTGLANVRDAIPFPRTPGNARY